MRACISRIVRRFCGLFPRPVKYVPVHIPVLESSLLQGRTALVTGGTSGIGLAIAEAYLRAGARVIISGRDEGRLSDAMSRLQSFGSVSTVVMDVSHPDSFGSILAGFEAFDILVNNAGYVGGGVFGSTDISEYEKVLDTNLKGAYFLSQVVSKRWIAAGVKGNILNICSASSLRPGNSPYILSKWGVRSLTVGMAKDLIKYGIVVNGLAPGCTNTEKFSSDGHLENPKNPSGRMVTMEEIANLAVVMVSPLARMVVGDVLYVTGGGAITTLDD